MHHWSSKAFHYPAYFTYFYLDSFKSAFQITSSSVRDLQKQSFRFLLKAVQHWHTWMQSAWWWAWLPESTLPGHLPILFQVHTCSIWLFTGIFQPHLCTLQGGLVLLLADGSWPFPCAVQMGTEYPQQWLKLEQFYRKHWRIKLRNGYRNYILFPTHFSSQLSLKHGVFNHLFMTRTIGKA